MLQLPKKPKAKPKIEMLQVVNPAVTLASFGFKHTAGLDADFQIVDVRDMKNPHSVSHLKNLTGLDLAVQEYVESDKLFSDKMAQALGHISAGQYKIAFGCLGGRHRSAAMVELLAVYLTVSGYQVAKEHTNL